MRGEYGVSRSQLKGHLFEMVILELLLQNGFTRINPHTEPSDRIREIREGFLEIKGRGCWHQIDCPCDYKRLMPFAYPLRLLGEVKFYRNPLEKKHVREFIGVIKDIQENYFSIDGTNPANNYPRKLEVGVYFSANGFQEEAEKLAYAHGIKTISYRNNYLVGRIKNLIDLLEENYLSVSCLNQNNWPTFRREFINSIRYGIDRNDFHWLPYYEDGYWTVLNELHNQLMQIRSSFFGTSATGVFIHFVGNVPFPAELFLDRDNGWCHIHYNFDEHGARYFWLEIANDPNRRRFYFTPPESLDEASVFGGEIVLNEKERIFKALNVNINLNGINRNLTLHIDEDWLDAARYGELD